MEPAPLFVKEVRIMQLAEVKSALNRPVIYGGTRYILKGCTLRKNEKTNELYYQAEIADFNSRSVLITRLSDIIFEEALEGRDKVERQQRV